MFNTEWGQTDPKDNCECRYRPPGTGIKPHVGACCQSSSSSLFPLSRDQPTRCSPNSACTQKCKNELYFKSHSI